MCLHKNRIGGGFVKKYWLDVFMVMRQPHENRGNLFTHYYKQVLWQWAISHYGHGHPARRYSGSLVATG
jgi:hypothetical protein